MKFFLFISSLISLALPAQSFAGEQGRFYPGLYGARDWFLPPEPGFYYAQPNFFYFTDEFHNGSGNTLDSLAIERSLSAVREFSGSRDFAIAKTRSTSFVLDYHGSHLDLTARLEAETVLAATLALDLEAEANLRADATVRAHLDDLDLRVASMVPTLVWKSENKLLGASFGAYASLPVVDLDIDALVSGTVDVDARVTGRLTASALATLSARTTANGSLTVAGPRGGSIQINESKSFSQTVSRSATVTREFGTDLSFQKKFKKRIRASATDIGDLYVQPLWLNWSGKHCHFSLSDGVYMPTGRYSPGALDNIGFGYWTNQTQLAAAWYPWKSQGTAISAATTYELHSNKEGEDIRPGDTLTVSWGLSQMLPLNKKQTMLAEIGLGGFDSFQVTDDRGSDVTYDPSAHDELHGAGVQFGMAFVKWKAGFSLRWMHEYGARDRFEGDLLVFKFSKKL